MRRFELHRDTDETGVSGTGVVAEGVEFGDGRAALRWRSEHRSTAVYDSMADVDAIHGHGGRTRIVYLDRLVEHGQCDAVAVLTRPTEVVRCEGNAGHQYQHGGHDSCATPLLWEGDAVVYPGRCICGVGSAEDQVCAVHAPSRPPQPEPRRRWWRR